MSSTPVHALVGAAAGVLPDVALLLVVGRKRWLPRQHPVIRVHAWLHRSPAGLALAAALGWASHLLLDAHTAHRTGAGTSEKRGWRW